MKTNAPGSYIGNLASTINGSSETTLYVLAVYFGSIGVTRSRHALPAGLLADLVGVLEKRGPGEAPPLLIHAPRLPAMTDGAENRPS
jgi:hypothetical protein